MTDTFSLDDIRSAADKQFKGLHLDLGNGDVIELRNVLRLPPEYRNKIIALQDEDREGIDEMLDMVRETILLVADNKENGARLLDRIGQDDATLLQLFRTWQEQTQVGEAEPSKS